MASIIFLAAKRRCSRLIKSLWQRQPCSTIVHTVPSLLEMWKKLYNSTATLGSRQDNRLHTFIWTLLIIVSYNIELGNGRASRLHVRTTAVFVTCCIIDAHDVRYIFGRFSFRTSILRILQYHCMYSIKDQP